MFNGQQERSLKEGGEGERVERGVRGRDKGGERGEREGQGGERGEGRGRGREERARTYTEKKNRLIMHA